MRTTQTTMCGFEVNVGKRFKNPENGRVETFFCKNPEKLVLVWCCSSWPMDLGAETCSNIRMRVIHLVGHSIALVQPTTPGTCPASLGARRGCLVG